MPQLDLATFAPQLVWLAISFFVLYFLMSRIGLPRVAVAIEARRRQREDDLERASQLRHEAEAVAAAHERARAAAREQAQATIRETSERLAAAAAARQRELSEVLSERIGAAERDIAAAKERALGDIHSVAADIAASIASRLIGAAPPQREIAAAVDRVVEERAGG
jgi:F-type H+-transporting ATPase subunit b